VRGTEAGAFEHRWCKLVVNYCMFCHRRFPFRVGLGPIPVRKKEEEKYATRQEKPLQLQKQDNTDERQRITKRQKSLGGRAVRF
jgi:hypothetical protein